MKIRLRLKPVQKGTIEPAAQYGERLLSVLYTIRHRAKAAREDPRPIHSRSGRGTEGYPCSGYDCWNACSRWRSRAAQPQSWKHIHMSQNSRGFPPITQIDKIAGTAQLLVRLSRVWMKTLTPQRYLPNRKLTANQKECGHGDFSNCQ